SPEAALRRLRVHSRLRTTTLSDRHHPSHRSKRYPALPFVALSAMALIIHVVTRRVAILSLVVDIRLRIAQVYGEPAPMSPPVAPMATRNLLEDYPERSFAARFV